MIRSHFQDLRRKKEAKERRDITLRMVAEETGLSYGAVQRVSSGNTERVYISTLDALCRYFQVVSIAELIEYSPQEDTVADGPGIRITSSPRRKHRSRQAK